MVMMMEEMKEEREEEMVENGEMFSPHALFCFHFFQVFQSNGFSGRKNKRKWVG